MRRRRERVVTEPYRHTALMAGMTVVGLLFPVMLYQFHAGRGFGAPVQLAIGLLVTSLFPALTGWSVVYNLYMLATVGYDGLRERLEAAANGWR